MLLVDFLFHEKVKRVVQVLSRLIKSPYKIKLIAERGSYVAQASKFKKNEDGVRDSSRVEKVIQKVREKAKLYGANPDMVEALYREMISRFINVEYAHFIRQ